MTTLLVTGGCGFIGSAVVRRAIAGTDWTVVNLDKLTYAADPRNVAMVADNPRYRFEQVDICDAQAVERVFAEHKPDLVAHLAAETHVDRSIDGPLAFVETNVIGTVRLLEAARRLWTGLDGEAKGRFRFLHVSTDEVFGALHDDDPAFCETTPYHPNSPYSASKASSDHMARAWHETYGLPVLISNCTNNYGPHQFPEKLIPVMIIKALRGEPLPVYGGGLNVRDWLYVDDHADALLAILQRGTLGETYCIGGLSEKRNIDVVHTLCRLLDERAPRPDGQPHASGIAHVTDRPGHDFRYAMDISHIQRTLGWTPQETFDSAMAKTVDWYLAHRVWWEDILAGRHTLGRLGLGG